MPTVYGYARASTAEQEQTLVAQAETLEKEYKHRFPGHAWGGVLVDRGVSGSVPLGQRPEGFKLLAHLKPGDVVIVTKLDRGFRSVADLCNTLNTWDRQGVRLVLLDLGMDTGTPVGRLIVHVMGAVAEFERKRIGERVREVHLMRKARGLPVAGKLAPYGFKVTGPKGKRRFVPDPYTRNCGRQFLAWWEAGWSDRRIYYHCLRHRLKTRANTEWSRTAIQRAIKGERSLQATEAAEAAKKKAEAGGEQSPRPPGDPGTTGPTS